MITDPLLARFRTWCKNEGLEPVTVISDVVSMLISQTIGAHRDQAGMKPNDARKPWERAPFWGTRATVARWQKDASALKRLAALRELWLDVDQNSPFGVALQHEVARLESLLDLTPTTYRRDNA